MREWRQFGVDASEMGSVKKQKLTTDIGTSLTPDVRDKEESNRTVFNDTHFHILTNLQSACMHECQHRTDMFAFSHYSSHRPLYISSVPPSRRRSGQSRGQLLVDCRTFSEVLLTTAHKEPLNTKERHILKTILNSVLAILF